VRPTFEVDVIKSKPPIFTVGCYQARPVICVACITKPNPYHKDGKGGRCEKYLIDTLLSL
jgi:hypothetical protein